MPTGAGADQTAGRRDRAQYRGVDRDHHARALTRSKDFRAAVGIIRLVKSYGRDRLEAACSRALESARAPSLPSIRS